jgi:23S rRNA pseudouridine1911/1915/1917 synthase
MTVTIDESGLRVDAALSQALPDLSRSAIQRLLEDGAVTLRGAAVKKNYKTQAGDVFEVTVPEAQPVDIVAQDIPLDVVYEDGDVIVLNKPKGMVVHPAAGHWDGTLVNALLHHCGDSLSGINGELRPGIVHRIDKDTSGLLIVAKNDLAHQGLAAQLKDHSLSRTYWCIVCGNIREDEGTISAPIGRHPADRKKMAVTEKNSRDAVTHFRVLRRYRGYTLVECRLETGRTHQIRVHMAYIGHPLLGDTVYGGRRDKGLSTQCLHARGLKFIHPTTGQPVELWTELPDWFQEAKDKLGPEIQ